MFGCRCPPTCISQSKFVFIACCYCLCIYWPVIDYLEGNLRSMGPFSDLFASVLSLERVTECCKKIHYHNIYFMFSCFIMEVILTLFLPGPNNNYHYELALHFKYRQLQAECQERAKLLVQVHHQLHLCTYTIIFDNFVSVCLLGGLICSTKIMIYSALLKCVS
jgi:hypothetical protein